MLGSAAAFTHRRAHHEDPLEERERDGEDRRISKGGQLVPTAGREHEQQEAHGDQRVADEIEAVGHGRRRNVSLDPADDVTQHEEPVAEGEEHPRQPALRPVEADREQDREHRAAADHVVEGGLCAPARGEREIDRDRGQTGCEIDAIRAHGPHV